MGRSEQPNISQEERVLRDPIVLQKSSLKETVAWLDKDSPQA